MNMNSGFNETEEIIHSPKQYRPHCHYRIGIIINCVVFCCIVIAVCATISTIQRHKVQNIKVEKTQDAYHIFMSSHTINDTDAVQNGQRKVPYSMVSTTEAVVIFIMMISGQHVLFTKNKTTNHTNLYTGKERPKNQTVSLLIKGEYLAPNTDPNTQKTTNTLLRAQGNNVTTGVVIPKEGIYYLYACLQLTWYKMSTMDSEVTHYVQLKSENLTIVISERKIHIPQRRGMYSTSRIFLPIKLKKNDLISMHASDSSYVYNSKTSNIIGVFRASVDH
ncbi:unnamed protein product [Mytilus edulis]|uniref:THD domain-containing protein n=1 Tax=Mytilus edulis TaxID=6550 RepID=A0A8S3TB95_MYTED|nr:unnamed protein product [Mytilus edulis]